MLPRKIPVEAIVEITKGGAHVSVDALGEAVTCRNAVKSLRSVSIFVISW